MDPRHRILRGARSTTSLQSHCRQGIPTIVIVGNFKQLIMLYAWIIVFLLHTWEPLQHLNQVLGDFIALPTVFRI